MQSTIFHSASEYPVIMSPLLLHPVTECVQGVGRVQIILALGSYFALRLEVPLEIVSVPVHYTKQENSVVFTLDSGGYKRDRVASTRKEPSGISCCFGTTRA